MARNMHRYEELTPYEFEREKERASIIYVSAGPLEYHEECNILGLDTNKGYDWCLAAAELTGGIVFPMLPVAPGGPFPFMSREDMREAYNWPQRREEYTESFGSLYPGIFFSREACRALYVELLEILANEGMFYLESDAERREVVLSLPKMDISDENTLSEALQMLGVETAFSANADFSAMSDVPMCIDDVVQKVRVQVDEQGTRAAAATAIAMRCMGMMPTEEPVEMIVNRPFVFVISDSETGSVYFAGAVDNPNG